uniref:Metalloendopeptidase n=1 Tax=Panagrolaimus superbus TaxID=310955 RepID=A0A914Y5F9_9BILA
MSILHDDIILSPKQIQMRKFNGAKNVAIKEKRNNRWENNIVPYKLSNRYTTSEKLIIENSLKAIEKVSCFRFPKYTYQKNFLDIDKQDGCYSYVGKIGGRQLLSLSEGCVYDFIIIHEVMHVLGLEHEHQRPDRDKYIKIQYQNVESDKMANFGLISPNEVDYKDHPYDYQSIMHYDGTAFGKRDPQTGKKLVTMMPLKTGIELLDNFKLTTLDIEKLNSLGKCSNFAGLVSNFLNYTFFQLMGLFRS